MIGGGFDNARGLSRALVERVRDEAQVLAASFDSAAEIPWSAANAYAAKALTPPEHAYIARAIWYLAGAAAALDMTPEELLAAAGATW